METCTIFLTIYFLVFQLPNSNAFHLDGVQKITEKNLKDLHSPSLESFTISNNTHTAIEAIPPSLNLSEIKSLSTTKSNADKPPTSKNELKIYGKPLPTAKYVVPEKSSASRNAVVHPKRQAMNHPTWHKISKEPHKFSTVNNAIENGFHGFDVVVVDIPSSHSTIRWDKPRMNSLASPSFRYAPVNRSPSIFDLLLGLDSISENVLTEPAEIGNEVYFQQSLDNPPWNRHLSFDRSINPAVIHQKDVNGNRFPKEVSETQFFGKFSEQPAKNCTCICEERKKVP